MQLCARQQQHDCARAIHGKLQQIRVRIQQRRLRGGFKAFADSRKVPQALHRRPGLKAPNLHQRAFAPQLQHPQRKAIVDRRADGFARRSCVQGEPARRIGRGGRIPTARRRRIARCGEGDLPQLGSGIVERQDLPGAHAEVPRHGLRSALTQADAVAPAAEADAEAVARIRHLDGLVGAGVDGQAVPALQAAVGGHVHRGRDRHRCAVGQPPGLHPQLEGQRAVESTGRRVLRILRREARDGQNPDVRRVPAEPLSRQHVLQTRPQRCLQRGMQIARVLGNVGGGSLRRGVPQIIGVVLHHAVAQAVAPGVLRGLGLAAIGGGIVAGCKRAAAVEHQAGRVAHRLNHLALAGIVALENLIGGGVHHIVAPGGLGGQLLRRIVACRDRLGLQRCQRIGIGHLVAHHAAEVVLHGNVQHRHDRRTAGAEVEIAAKDVCQRRRLKAYAAAAAAQQTRTGAAVQLHAIAGQTERTAVRAQRNRAACGQVQRKFSRAEIVAVRDEAQLRRRSQPRELHPHQSARFRPARRKLRPGQQQNQRQQRAQRPANPAPRGAVTSLSHIPDPCFLCTAYTCLASIIHDRACLRQFFNRIVIFFFASQQIPPACQFFSQNIIHLNNRPFRPSDAQFFHWISMRT